MQFIYPKNQDAFLRVKDKEQVRQSFQKQMRQYNLSAQFFKISLHKNKIIYCICTKCSARIKLVFDGQIFRLANFNNRHNHQLIQRDRIGTYLKSLPTNITTLAAKQLVKSQFSYITDSQFYYLRRKYLLKDSKISSLDSFINYMRTQKILFDIGSLDERGNPEYIHLITPNMVQNYNRTGYCVKIDYTFNLFSNSFHEIVNNIEQNRSYTLGVISGFNSRNKLTIYALSVSAGQLFFINSMKSDCDTIISDLGVALKSAISDLVQQKIFSGQHCFDLYHFYKTLNFKSRKQWQIIKLMPQAQLSEYKHLIQQLKSISSIEEQQQIQKIKKYDSKMFISTIKPLFIGLSSSSSSTQKINDLIKKECPYSSPIYDALQKIIQTCNNRNIISNSSIELQSCPFQDYLQVPDLAFLRAHMAKAPFLRLIQQVGKSIHHSYDTIQSKSIVTDKYGQKFQLQFTQKWRCSCFYFQKTFLPCSHIIGLVKKDMISQVADFWIVKDIEQNTIRKIYSRKKTRRNKG